MGRIPSFPLAVLAVLRRLAGGVDTVFFGSALPLTGQIAIPGRGFLRALDIGLEHLNADLPPGSSFRFASMPVCDTETSVLHGADCAMGFADFCGTRGYRPVGVYGAGFSSVTLQMLPITTRFKLLQCSPLSSTTDLSAASSYPYFFRTAAADDKRAIATLASAQAFGWDRAVLMYTTDRYGTTNGEQIRNRAVSFGIMPENLAVLTLPPSFYLLDAGPLADLERDILVKVRRSQTRVVMVIALLDDSEAIFRMAVAGNIIGPGWAWLGADAWSNLGTTEKLAQLDDGSLGFSRKDLLGSVLVVAFEEETATTKRLLESYVARHGTSSMEPFIMAGYDCVRALGLAVLELLKRNTSLSAADLGAMSLDSGIQEQLAKAAMSLEFEGAGGFVQFAKYGSPNAGDRVPRYSVRFFADAAGGANWIERATFDENRAPAFVPQGPIIFSNGRDTLPAAAPGCPPGSELSEDGSSCTACAEGTYQLSTSRTPCAPCLAGFACPPGSASMNPCPPGTNSSAGSAECSACAVGTASSAAAAEFCVPCPAGFYQHVPGSQRCEACELGRFQELVGQSSCNRCPETMTTELPGTVLASSCGCGAGTRFVSEFGQCVPCGSAAEAGITCEFFDSLPLVAKGFFMFDDSPRDVAKLDVFKCQSSEACKGQVKYLNDTICAEHREGLNCAICEAGYQGSTDGSTCEKCDRRVGVAVPFVVIGLILVVGALHYLWNHGRSEQVEAVEGALFSETAGTSLQFIQTLAIFRVTLIRWPKAFRDLLDMLSIVLFDLGVFQAGCVLEPSLAVVYGASLLIPIMFILVVASWWVWSRLAHRCCRRFPRFMPSELVSTAGLVFVAVYIAVCESTLALVDCYTGPNEKMVVRQYPFSLCSGSQYMSTIPLFVFGVLLYLVSVLGSMVYVLYIAPMHYHMPAFRTAIRFMVYKFRPSCWWFSLVLNLRSFSLSMVTVIFPDSMQLQFVCLVLILCVSIVVHVSYDPYTQRWANVLETCELLGLLAILLLGLASATDDEESTSMYGIAGLSIFGFVSLLCIGFMFFALVLANSPKLKAKIRGNAGSVAMGRMVNAARLLGDPDSPALRLLFDELATYKDIQHFEKVAFLLEMHLSSQPLDSLPQRSCSVRSLECEATRSELTDPAQDSAQQKSESRPSVGEESISEGYVSPCKGAFASRPDWEVMSNVEVETVRV
mmetsp:Transcript_73551/g.213043  ORF Transcript_73551/g.213043 Transcript_73551/m.213043 type:complete len:1193 (-) Transcript_73551:47-3625(-)